MGIGYNYQQIQAMRAGWGGVLGIAVYAAVFLLCVHLFFSRTSEKKSRPGALRLAGLLPAAALPILIRMIWQNDMLYFGASICMLCAYGSVFYKRKGGARVYDLVFAAALSGAYIVLTLLFGLLVSGVGSSYLKMILWQNTQYEVFAYYLAEALAVWAITVIFLRLARSRGADRKLTWRYLVLGFFPLAFVILLVGVLGNCDWLFLWYGGAPVLACILLIVGMNVFTVYLFGYMERQQRQELELSLYRQQEELLFHQYRELEEKYQASRKVVHDVKNHMQMLDSLYRQGEFETAGQYRRDIDGMLRTLERVRYTDHPMLNLLLNEKLNQEELKGVELKVRIGDADLTFMRDIDVTTIFANLLDNAIEAAAASEKPLIRLELAQLRSFIVIRLENSIGKKPKDASLHMGLGMKNVENALSFYGGTMTAQEERERFKINITIPADSAYRADAGQGIQKRRRENG